MRPLPCRLLVDLPNWLGDLIHAIPALHRLEAGNRGGVTVAVAPDALVPVVRLLGIEALPRPRRAGFRWARASLAGRFDVAITARHSTRCKLLLRGSGTAITIGSRGRGADVLGLETFKVDRRLHQSHDLDGVLRVLGLGAVAASDIRLALPAGLRAHGDWWRGRLDGRGRLIAVLPGTRHTPEKRYPIAELAEVARGLGEAGATPVVVAGPGEEDLTLKLASVPGVRIAPVGLALDRAAALLSACDAAVGSDSGLTHLAAAVGCPTVALFGPTEPSRTAPVGGAVVLRATPFAGRSAWAMLPPAPVVEAVLAQAHRPRLTRVLHDAGVNGMIPPGSGPLAQLAEQGTLNP